MLRRIVQKLDEIEKDSSFLILDFLLACIYQYSREEIRPQTR